MSLENQILAIDDRIPYPWEIFTPWFYEPVGVIQNYYFYYEGERPCVDTLYELLELPQSKAIKIGDMVFDCEWPNFHFHLGSANNRFLSYLDNYDDLYTDWINHLVLNNLVENHDFDPENSLTSACFDNFGAYFPNTNSVIIDIYKIEDYVTQDASIFTFSELFQLVLFHEYGHWMAYNLNITCTERDSNKIGDSYFQELFAQLFTAHMLHRDGNIELRRKMDEFSRNSQPVIYQNYLKDCYKDVITNSDLLAFVLYTARNSYNILCNEIGLLDKIEYALDSINNGPISLIYENNPNPSQLPEIEYGTFLFKCIDDWKKAIREITNQEWINQEYFSKDVVNNDMLLNTECKCGRDEYSNKEVNYLKGSIKNPRFIINI